MASVCYLELLPNNILYVIIVLMSKFNPEKVIFREGNITAYDFTAIQPEKCFIDFYSDMIVTHSAEITLIRNTGNIVLITSLDGNLLDEGKLNDHFTKNGSDVTTQYVTESIDLLSQLARAFNTLEPL